jgi:hypothetical protein
VTAIEQASTRPRQIDLRRIALLTLAAPLWLLGCLAGAVSVAAVWVCVAVRLGWLDARAFLRRR